MSLSINPSYQTSEVTYDSCPCGSAASDTTQEALEWTKNYPKVQGNSVLGTYGATNYRFEHPPLTCNTCTECESNAVSTLFYRPARPVLNPTYGFVYKGKDELYRVPY
jgi:hypothetical protein